MTAPIFGAISGASVDASARADAASAAAAAASASTAAGAAQTTANNAASAAAAAQGTANAALAGNPPARSFNHAAGRSLVTGTGATGFQVSATRDAIVNYNVLLSCTATIGGAAVATVVLEVAATNSATPGDWKEIARASSGQTITLAVVLQSVQTAAGQLSGVVPAGFFAKLRSTTSGTASATFNTGQEVLI